MRGILRTVAVAVTALTMTVAAGSAQAGSSPDGWDGFAHRSGAVPGSAPGSTVASAPVRAGGPGAGVVVRTPLGALRGTRAEGVDSFLGVRYAEPPTGDRRWTPPRRVRPWTGVLPATEYGNRCPANESTNGPLSLTEDCLFLNVQRPARSTQDRRLPVYVWLHGGGLVNGSSNQHDGTKIVQETGVVVVTVNYRLGVLGFLAHPALSADQGDSGNYGFLDQQTALRWVQQNIAAFGGDPLRVTLGGESAGAFSTCGHLTSPGSRGLFAQALLQSGGCGSWSLTEAESFADQVSTAVGCPDASQPTALACLRAAPTQSLLDAGNTWFGPALTSGGTTLPRDPGEAVSAGDFARVPVLIGANRDEGRTFTQDLLDWTEETYLQFLSDEFGDRAAEVEARYPWPSDPDRYAGAYLVGAIGTDADFFGLGGCTNRALTNEFAGFVPTYSYQFDHRTGPGLTPLPGYVWGAGHAAELAYQWPSFDNGTPIAPLFDRSERRLARDMNAYWGAFIRSGHPDSAGGATWPRLRSELGDQAKILSLRAGGRSTTITDARLSAQHQCDFWATF